MMVAVRAFRPGRLAADVAVSAVAVFVTAVGSADRVAAWVPRGANVPIAVAMGLLLLARRRAPLAVLATTTLLGTFMRAVGYPGGTAIFATCCAGYAVAMYGRRAEGAELAGTLRGAAAVLLAALTQAVTGLVPSARDPSGVWGGLGPLIMATASWVLGYALRTRRAYVAELKERATRAVMDERLRIARELHDVIGHSISLIAIQAEAATRSARSNPQAVPGFLSSISVASRQALTEMRGVLAVLRPDAEAQLSPQPGLEQLDELVASLRAGGLETRLEMPPIQLPPGIALTVYRIVQESLTNVLKHAGAGATADVTIDRNGSTVRICVHDDGAGPSGPAPGAAHGIVGMRERVAAYGGTLRTGARPGGGFAVEASIPLPEQESP